MNKFLFIRSKSNGFEFNSMGTTKGVIDIEQLENTISNMVKCKVDIQSIEFVSEQKFNELEKNIIEYKIINQN